jgi:23S rRNA (guanosine2251-2'-O)-methyltransferase
MRKLANEELDRKNIEEFKEASKTPIIIILDDIRSLHNIGSVFRSSDAFLVEKIYLCGITAVPPNKEIHKTALGATETVTWEYAENVIEVIEKLKQDKISVYAIEQTENSIFGNEVKGVNQKAINASDGVIEIPQLGSKHSLNISVSAGIVIWDLFQKIK